MKSIDTSVIDNDKPCSDAYETFSDDDESLEKDSNDGESKKKNRKKVKISTNAQACHQNETSIRERPKFHHHYEQIFNDQVELINEKNKCSKVKETNPYHSLPFLRLISSHMYIAPLWSSLIEDAKDNNPSETDFRIHKHTTLDNLRNMPITIASNFQKRIASQAILYDLNSVSFLSKITPIAKVNDIWVDKKAKKNQPRVNHITQKMI